MAPPHLYAFSSCLFLFAHPSLLGSLVGSSAFHHLLAVLILLLSAFPLHFLPFFLFTLQLSLLFSHFHLAWPAPSLLLLLPALISCPLLLFFVLSSFLSSLMVSLRNLCYFPEERKKLNSKLTQLGMKPVFLMQLGEKADWIIREHQPYFWETKTSDVDQGLFKAPSATFFSPRS